MIQKIFDKKKLKQFLTNILFIIYIFCYCYLFLFFSSFLQLKILIFTILLTCVASDLGGYIFGKTFKGAKLTRISPKKTISGAPLRLRVDVVGDDLFAVHLGLGDVGDVGGHSQAGVWSGVECSRHESLIKPVRVDLSSVDLVIVVILWHLSEREVHVSALLQIADRMRIDLRSAVEGRRRIGVGPSIAGAAPRHQSHSGHGHRDRDQCPK